MTLAEIECELFLRLCKGGMSATKAAERASLATQGKLVWDDKEKVYVLRPR